MLGWPSRGICISGCRTLPPPWNELDICRPGVPPNHHFFCGIFMDFPCFMDDPAIGVLLYLLWKAHESPMAHLPKNRDQFWELRIEFPKRMLVCFFPNSVSTLRGFYGESKGRCLIRVLTLGRGIFPVNFRVKWLFGCLL